MQITSGLKEWSIVIDALGSGIQILVIRTYPPSDKTFLLYPTFSYYANRAASPGKLKQLFQDKYLEIASKSGEAVMNRARYDCLVDIKYFAKVVETIEFSNLNDLGLLEKYSIWTKQHLTDYAKTSKSGKCYIWVLRIYKLPSVLTFGRIAQGGPPNFYIPPKPAIVNDEVPVIEDTQFQAMLEDLKQVLNKSNTYTPSSKSASRKS